MKLKSLIASSYSTRLNLWKQLLQLKSFQEVIKRIKENICIQADQTLSGGFK